MRVGFIGAGVICAAILRGIVKSGAINPRDIGVYDILTEKAAALGGEFGFFVPKGAAELVGRCDVVILAVKPNRAAGVLTDICKTLNKVKPLLISVVAGKTFTFIEHAAGIGLPIARVIPNTNADVCESMSVVCFNNNVTEEQKAATLNLFNAVGQTCTVEDESQMGSLSCLCGCSPAYAYMFIDALAKSAHKAGIDKKTALRLAAQTVLGSAKMALESDLHPAQLMDNVCSPGGTTIEGVCVLEERGFTAAVVAALDSAIEKNGRV